MLCLTVASESPYSIHARSRVGLREWIFAGLAADNTPMPVTPREETGLQSDEKRRRRERSREKKVQSAVVDMMTEGAPYRAVQAD